MENYIHVNGARENNLKNVTVKIPHGKHTIIAGISGSGKSSLAYDVIYAAGQKRLMDCLSEKSTRFIQQIKQPDVNFIDGLTPVISVKQYTPNINTRSTVGSLSEISTYLRYLYSVMGQASCPICHKSHSSSHESPSGRPSNQGCEKFIFHTSSHEPLFGRQSNQGCEWNIHTILTLKYLINELEKLPQRTAIELQFPIYKNISKKYEDFFFELRQKGFKRIVIDGELKDLRDWIAVEKDPDIMFVVGGVIQIAKELSHSDIQILKNTLLHGHGFFKIVIQDENERKNCEWFFTKHGCSEHEMFTANIAPQFFSFNDLSSCCDECNGSGVTKKAVPEALVQNKKKSLRQGPFFQTIYDHKKSVNYMTMYSLSKHYGFSFNEPFENLPDYARDIIFNGTKGQLFPLIRPEGYDKEMTRSAAYSMKIGANIEFEGLVKKLDKLYKNSKNSELVEWQEYLFNTFMIDEVCISCHGTRLKPQREWITINGLSYNSLGNMELVELQSFLSEIPIPSEKKNAVLPIINEITLKLKSFIDIGLGYLYLNRRTDTLSGGEYQRIRLAGQIGSGLIGLTYIIDEPTVGLHGIDTIRIINYLDKLCSQGNTVITIEHDLDIVKNADYIIEMGSGAGVNGGEIIARGSLEEIKSNKNSVIASILNDTKSISFKQDQTKTFLTHPKEYIRIIGGEANNLKKIDVSIPLYQLVCLTGVSGSGKSSLAIEILYKSLWSSLHDARMIPGKHKAIEGMENIKDVYCIDQSPISKAKTSIPATYIGVFDAIRKVFAECDDALRHELNHISYYSFNSDGGCSSCKGVGYLDTHIHYMGNVKIDCPVCNGKRYNDEVLEVFYKEKNIAGVLELTIEDAVKFFADQTYIYNKLKYLYELGLEYMTLGQSLNTISGGESGRLRLAREISKIRGTKNTLYILDEPTTGLHFKDIQKLLRVFAQLIDKGNSVILIEHNPDVILSADYVIDIGPEAGNKGGEIVIEGTPGDVMACNKSYTGQYLKDYIRK